MLSRLAYLLKYSSESKDKEKKKKKKKEKKEKASDEDDTIIVGHERRVVKDTLDDEPYVLEQGDDVNGDGVPVQVEVTREFKGFRRIDTQELVQETTNDGDEPKDVQQLQETIYRDISGRKIDITEKREEVRLKKEKESLERAQRSDYIKNDESQVSYRVERKRLNEFFDDPFKSVPTLRDNSLSYKGMHSANRFGMTSGILWDGINRSNGFEQLLMKKRQEQNVHKLEAKNEEEYDFE
ncbi:Pre-mRNA-splicing factor cwc26 [Scheffersomyces spartinae]|uniref:Pre-mRNA-splicing factor CWC26 n=1 Tax=Scheffersomyces spartinae TaxID=45513 RepID=A0A9P7VBF8_9ASCO|nr:Pre-mRNA-splicing factor cwc26 [Scheffersomyces spartinae]KAG7194451.1 Pre-mRNA-splicing factor cwc26 [Scheffersomyces spartinae]